MINGGINHTITNSLGADVFRSRACRQLQLGANVTELDTAIGDTDATQASLQNVVR